MPRKPKSKSPTGDGNGASSVSAARKPHRDVGDREFPPHLLRDRRRQNDQAPEEVDVETLVPNAVFVARDAISSEECRMWIDYAEGGMIGDGGWDKVSHPANRECGRIQRSDWDMSHRLFRRIEGIVRRISPQLNIADEAALLSNLVNVRSRGGVEKSGGPPPRKKYRPVTCNPNLRLYKYTKGQWFGRHVDESNEIDFPPRNSGDLVVDGPLSAVDARDGRLRTEITVLFYLSSCRGGATRFHLPHGRKSSVAFVPEEGAVLLHVHGDHCLEHEAEPVLEGVKYGE